MRLDDLPTPALVLDRAVLARNLVRMRDRAARLGVRLRPHLKTAKSADVARLALGDGGDGITVSTLAEARYFLERGFRDIIYAVGIAPAKLDEVAALRRQGADLAIVTDDLEAARAVARRGAELGTVFPVLVEIDSGAGRAGVDPAGGELVDIGRVLATGPGAELRGVLTHAGHSYRCAGPAEIRAVAAQERAEAVLAADRLRQAGLPCPVVSVGSTPTALFAERLDGVTEMRPGVYMFMDLYQQSLGVCDEADVAVSVLASVIGHRADRGRLLVDAGALALSQDGSLPGFGRVAGRALAVAKVNQEHGFVEPLAGAAAVDLPVGSRLRLLPNHACMTAGMYDRYHVVDGGDEVVAVWERCRGW